MNNRSSVNESNLVTFSPDLASLNSLDKNPLINYPFDHLYACHSQKSDSGQSLTLDKNVEISTHCLLQSDKTIKEKDAEILSLKNQNKRLKELLVYHLDLIQQQNDAITNREKTLIHTGNLHERVIDRQVVRPPPTPTVAHKLINPPLIHGPTTSTITSVSESLEVALPNPALGAHGAFNTLEELGLEPHSKGSFVYNNPAVHDINFDIDTSDTFSGLQEYPIPTLEATDPNCELTPLESELMMINRPVPVAQDAPPRLQVSEAPKLQPQEPNYAITTNSGMSVTKNSKMRRKTILSSMCRMKPKPEPSTIYDNEIYSVNKKAAKTLNKYGKQSNATPTKNRHGRRGGRQSNTRQSNSSQINNSPLPGYPYSGSLSDRLQLIDTTPTGEDPYQIGEAEMREQSPIPRLVLPTRVRAHTAELSTTVATSRRIYDPEPERAESPTAPKPKKNKRVSKPKTNQRKSANAQFSTTSSVKSTAKSQKRKKEDVDWEPYTKKPKLTSLNDFSYGETALKLPAPSGELVTSKKLPSATLIPNSKLDLYTSCNLDKMQDISKMSYNEIFDTELPDEESSDVVEPVLEAQVVEPVEVVEPIPTPTKKRGARTASLAGSSTGGEEANADVRRGAKSKRGGRKRALSSASTTKREKAPPKPRASRGRGGYRGRRGSSVSVPPLTTREPYHTAMGNADGSWYLGHDPDIKKEDLDQLAEDSPSNVEVPRWRQMDFTSQEPIDDAEKTEDEMFRKRHHKLEAEERRQLRWHMRRVREQRHVEKLRLRQRDPWTVSTLHNPPIYSVWPSPLRDLQFIEITDILPVLAFGENIPLLPNNDFSLPWENVDKAQKITKRAKTLH